MGLEELNVRAEVGAQVAAAVQRDQERLEPPDPERGSEADRDGRPGLGYRRSAPGEPRTDLAKRAHWRPEYLGHRGPAGILSAVSPAPQISVVIPCLDEEQAV